MFPMPTLHHPEGPQTGWPQYPRGHHPIQPSPQYQLTHAGAK